MNSDGWKKLRFAEILSVPLKNGLTKPTKVRGVGYKMVNMGELFANSIIRETDMERVPMTESEFDNYLLESYDLLFARQSLTIEGAGKCSLFIGSSEPTTFEGHLIRARINKVFAEPSYLYYYFNSNYGKDQIKSIVSVTAAAGIRGSDLANLEILLPPLDTQRFIVDILSALDDKIELNRQTNATLEALAQAIFKEWFVDFNYPGATGEMVDSELGPIPRGWRVGILSEVLSSIESGSRPKGGVGDLAEGIPSIGAENINGLGFYDFSKEKFVSEEFFAKLKSGIVKSEDVLLYKDGASLGRKTMFMDGFPHQICAINEHVFILRSNNLINQLFLYFWLDQSYMTENIKSLNSNSAQPGINQPAVRSLPILIPEKTISEKFEQIVKPLLSKLFNDCKESYSLSLLRDKLLPKLMSGEIQI